MIGVHLVSRVPSPKRAGDGWMSCGYGDWALCCCSHRCLVTLIIMRLATILYEHKCYVVLPTLACERGSLRTLVITAWNVYSLLLESRAFGYTLCHVCVSLEKCYSRAYIGRDCLTLSRMLLSSIVARDSWQRTLYWGSLNLVTWLIWGSLGRVLSLYMESSPYRSLSGQSVHYTTREALFPLASRLSTTSVTLIVVP